MLVRFCICLFCVVVIMTGTAVSNFASGFERPVEVLAFENAQQTTPFKTEYGFLNAASKKWTICAVLPNDQDSYWDYTKQGLLGAARRLQVDLKIHSAQSYEEQGAIQQKNIIERRCLREEVDLILIAAVDESQLASTIEAAHKKGIVVVDLLNGFNSPYITAHASLDFAEMGKTAAVYVLTHFIKTSPENYCLYWLPGPLKPQWSQRGNAGFQSVMSGKRFRTFKTIFGTPFIRSHKKLIEENLNTQECQAIVVGTGPSAAAAHMLKEEGRLAKDTIIFSYYFNPAVNDLLLKNRIEGSVTDSPVQQGELALDLGVRILEGKPYFYKVAITPSVRTPPL